VELIGIVLLAVLGVLGAALSRQLTDEFKAWTPRTIEWLIRCAVRKLPEDQRGRYEEEWRSHIDETPGEIGKFYVALRLLSAPWRMPNRMTASQRGFDEPAQEEMAIVTWEGDPAQTSRQTELAIWAVERRIGLQHQLDMLQSGRMRTGERCLLGGGWTDIDTTSESIERVSAQIAQLNRVVHCVERRR
jgi:hypothetical protein